MTTLCKIARETGGEPPTSCLFKCERSCMKDARDEGREQRVMLTVDMSYQAYRASAAFPMLTSRRVFTGGLYGFLVTFAKAVRETRATDVAFCLDVKPYLRSIIYPEYKQIRKKNADEELLKMYKQSMALILELFAAIGVHPWGIPGFESDDLTAHIARKYRGRFHRVYASSNDSDLFQLFKYPNFHVYKDSIRTLQNASTLKDSTGLSPEQFMLTTALQGTHNDIAGIPGVGVITAKSAIFSPSVMRNLREKAGDIIDRNLDLIKLPHPALPYEASPPRHERFNARAFNRFCSMYDIDVMVTMERAFQQFQGD